VATPRKRFAVIETTILREPWPDEIKLTLVLLTLHMSERWAAEKLSSDQATRCRLSPGDALNVTSATSLEGARDRLRSLAQLVKMSVKISGNLTEIRWKKIAITQGWEEIDRRRAAASRGKDSVEHARATPEQPPEQFPSVSASVSASEEVGEEKKRKELPSVERGARSPLLNLLKNLPGDEAEKLAWLADEGPQIEVDAASYGKAVPSLTVRYYRRYLAGERRHKNAAEEAIRAAKRKAWHAEHGADYEAHLRATGGVA